MLTRAVPRSSSHAAPPAPPSPDCAWGRPRTPDGSPTPSALMVQSTAGARRRKRAAGAGPVAPGDRKCGGVQLRGSFGSLAAALGLVCRCRRARRAARAARSGPRRRERVCEDSRVAPGVSVARKVEVRSLVPWVFAVPSLPPTPPPPPVSWDASALAFSASSVEVQLLRPLIKFPLINPNSDPRRYHRNSPVTSQPLLLARRCRMCCRKLVTLSLAPEILIARYYLQNKTQIPLCL